MLTFLLLMLAQDIPIDRDGIVVREDVRLRPGTYRVQDADGDGVIRIESDGVTVDLGEAIIDGSAPGAGPDAYLGFGIYLENRKDVTIRGGTIRGFKVGIYAKGCTGLKILDCEVTENFRQRLRSTPEREDASDWLWPHHNDENEWARNYGAAIYLDGCRGATVARCKGRDQQNGILLSRTEGSHMHDNDFSFHSGWGLGMWRASGNEISHNKFDWCVRGYSHGVYHRGQDSAGILVFEQCNDNVFAFNSATHGGDGFFLYAGHETTQRTGEGGCNGNLVFGNDFSHAVANGIEATFSDRNIFSENILDECDYGVWAGYSYGSMFHGNRISRSLTAGIAIEHGHDNNIIGNTFDGDRRGIWLWWDEDKEFLESIYGKKQNTDSEQYLIQENRFRRNPIAILLQKTSDVKLWGNTFEKCDEERKEQDCKDVEERDEKPWDSPADPAPEVEGTQNAFLPDGALRGRKTMMIDEWGPVDPTRTRLFPSRADGWGEVAFHLLGPGGQFEAQAEGVEVLPEKGELPGTIRVRSSSPGLREFQLKVEVGEEVLTSSGTIISSRWKVRFRRWDPQGPRKGPADWEAVLESEVIDEMDLDRLDFRWGGGAPSGKVPGDHFATVAESEIPLPAGTYEFRTVSDDGVRLAVGGEVIIEDWTWHPPKEHTGTVTLEEGTHRLRLEHFEIDGHSRLSLYLRRR